MLSDSIFLSTLFTLGPLFTDLLVLLHPIHVVLSQEAQVCLYPVTDASVAEQLLINTIQTPKRQGLVF